MCETDCTDVGNRDAFVLSSAGVAHPLTTDALVEFLTVGIPALTRIFDFQTMVEICAPLRSLADDLSDDGQRARDEMRWAGSRFDEMPEHRPRRLRLATAERVAELLPEWGLVVRLLLSHESSLLARQECGPWSVAWPLAEVPGLTPGDVFRHWEARTFDRLEHEARSALAREAEQSRPNRAERRRVEFGRLLPLVPHDRRPRFYDDPPPRRRPVSEPRIAHGPPAPVRTLAA